MEEALDLSFDRLLMMMMNIIVGSATLSKSSRFAMHALKQPTYQTFNEWQQISADSARVR